MVATNASITGSKSKYLKGQITELYGKKDKEKTTVS